MWFRKKYEKMSEKDMLTYLEQTTTKIENATNGLDKSIYNEISDGGENDYSIEFEVLDEINNEILAFQMLLEDLGYDQISYAYLRRWSNVINAARKKMLVSMYQRYKESNVKNDNATNIK